MNFCKRTALKDNESVGDIPKSWRIICILQLCLAFTTLLWVLGSPFTDELYKNRKALSSIEWLTDEGVNEYATLTSQQKTKLEEIRSGALEGMQEPFLQKLGQSIESLFRGTPISKLAWLVLAFLLPIFVMKQVDGARELFWLFPLLAILYIWQVAPMKSGESLIPDESYLEHHYLSAPISGTVAQQREQLEEAWENYIIAEWSKSGETKDEKFSNGMYHFVFESTVKEWEAPPLKPGLITVGSYLIWNLIAALGVSMRKKVKTF